jgi:hypothetical protein
MVTLSSNKIKKPQKVKKRFPSLFIFCSNFFFLGSTHDTLITILNMDNLFSLEDSKSNGKTPLQHNPRFPNM